MPDHLWLRGRFAADRVRLRAELDLPPALADVDAHRGLRGPYTAGGTLLRALADDAFARCPELAARHHTELAAAAPELAEAVVTGWETLEWVVGEPRYYPRLRTRDIANGIADFLHVYLASLGDEPRTLFVDNVHHADPTDRELLAVLLRRQDIPQLTLVLGTGLEPVEDPPGEVAVSLAAVLPGFARVVDVASGVASAGPGFVDSDGTTDDPDALAEYEALPAEERARRHDVRCAELSALGEQSLALGAIPFHAVRGSRPGASGVRAVQEALGHCRKAGLYHAAAEFGMLGRTLVERASEEWWHFTEAAAAALSVLGRVEALDVYEEAGAAAGSPERRLRVACGMALLHVRDVSAGRGDLGRARTHLVSAVDTAARLVDPAERDFHTAFARNGLALVETHEGRLDEALRLIEDGQAALERVAGEHVPLRSVLGFNRGLVLDLAGRPEEALAQHGMDASADPGFFGHHLRVGVLLRRMGRDAEALEAFERVLPLVPPFPEVHYELAGAWLASGDVRRALAAFDYVLELDPGHVAAIVDRADTRCEVGDTHGAWDDVRIGLRLSPDNVRLLCVQGRLFGEAGDHGRASDAVSAALRIDPGFVAGWALRGRLRFDAGDSVGALADLDQAVALADGPGVRFDRAVVFEKVGRFRDAAADYRAVLAVAEDADARSRLEFCLRAG